MNDHGNRASQPGRRQALTILAGVAAAIAGPLRAQTSAWPTRSPRYVVPFATGGVTANVGRLLAQALAAVLRQPEVQLRLREMGVEPDGRGAAELAAFQRTEVAKWGRVIQAAGIQAE